MLRWQTTNLAELDEILGIDLDFFVAATDLDLWQEFNGEFIFRYIKPTFSLHNHLKKWLYA